MSSLLRHRTRAQLSLDGLGTRRDVKVKDIHGQADGGAGVGNVDDSGDVALDGDAAEHQVDLVVGVAVAFQVLDDAQARLPVRDRRVHVVLLAVLVDAEALEVDHAAGRELAVGDV